MSGTGSKDSSVSFFSCFAFRFLLPKILMSISGLAAARAAKANAGPQNSHGSYGGQDHRSKRQKTGSGPVVTRYPVPGPVVTKYGPPPNQHPPYGGPQGFHGMPPQQFPQGQYGPHPQQQFAPQNVYAPYGYQGPPMPQAYNQFGHQPLAPYGQGYGPIPPQGQGYGNGPPASGPYYGQPYGPQVPYGPPVPQQYPHQAPMPYPPQHHQAPYPQQNQPMGYGPPQQAGPYQSGPYPQGGPQAQPSPYNMPPQHPHAQTQGQPPVTYQFQGQGAQEYDGSSAAYPNQQSQQGVQTPVPTHWSPAHGGPSNHSDQNNAQSGKPPGQDANGLPTNDESSIQKQPIDAADGTTETHESPSHDVSIDEFDIDWEESVFNDLIRVLAIAILTPLSTRFDEEPLASDSDAPIKSKYVRPGNLEVFILPIQKSLHWAILHTDPALAKIDEAYPAVPFEMWDEYREERKKRKMFEARLYDAARDEQSREAFQVDEEYQAIREASTGSTGRQESSRGAAGQFSADSQRDSRSRSRTPGYSRGSTLAPEDGDDRWVSRTDEEPVKAATYVDPAEAVLASLGVTGAPKPVSVNTAAFNDGQKDSMQQSSPRRQQIRQDSGYASARPSTGRQSSWGSNGPAFRRPSKPTRIRSGYDGSIDSPISEVSIRSHNSERDPGKRGSKSMSPVESPLSPTSAMLVGEAPASHEDRYRTREPLRQNDDQYVKKRPQPKVAEAYSRRW
ncbi:hypothetical protein ACLOAV_005417 [Pseudogymnoascus australis]